MIHGRLQVHMSKQAESRCGDEGVQIVCQCADTNKTTQQLYKVYTPCIDDHHFKEEEMKSVGELSNTCSQIVLKC